MEKILIVDDDNELRSCLSIILAELGYSSDTASSGEEAMNRVEKDEYKVVLLDLMMPGINGMDVLGRIKSHSPQTKVIMITAFSGFSYWLCST